MFFNPWLPKSSNSITTSQVLEELANTCVCDLMMPEQLAWDVDVIRDLFEKHEASLIFCLPLSLMHREDSWTWIFEDKGYYYVKSAYRTFKQDSFGISSDVWKLLWSSEIPSKI